MASLTDGGKVVINEQKKPVESPVLVLAPKKQAAPAPSGPAANQNSIVDYLSSIGAPHDVHSRAEVASKLGLVKTTQEYIDSANANQNGDINTKMLQMMKHGQGSGTSNSNMSPKESSAGSALGSAITSTVGTNPPVPPAGPPATSGALSPELYAVNQERRNMGSEQIPQGGVNGQDTYVLPNGGTVTRSPGSPPPEGGKLIAGPTVSAIPHQNYINKDGTVNTQAYMDDAKSNASQQLQNARQINEDNARSALGQEKQSFDDWQHQFKEQRAAAVENAKRLGDPQYTNAIEMQYQEEYDRQSEKHQGNISAINTQKSVSDLSSGNDHASMMQAIDQNVATIGQTSAQFNATTQNQAMSQFRQLLSTTDVSYSNSEEVKNMTDEQVASKYGALVDMARKGGLSYKDAASQIRDGVYQQAKAKDATHIAETRAELAQKSLAVSVQRLSIASERANAYVRNVNASIATKMIAPYMKNPLVKQIGAAVPALQRLDAALTEKNSPGALEALDSYISLVKNGSITEAQIKGITDNISVKEKITKWSNNFRGVDQGLIPTEVKAQIVELGNKVLNSYKDSYNQTVYLPAQSSLGSVGVGEYGQMVPDYKTLINNYQTYTSGGGDTSSASFDASAAASAAGLPAAN